MNFEGEGKPFAVIENTEDKKDRKIVYITETPNKLAGSCFNELRLKDKPNLRFQPIPNKEIEREVKYITGCSGAGKSYWIRNYAEEYHRAYPKREIYVVSSLKDDPTLDKLKYLKRIKIHEPAFMNESFDVNDFKDSLVIFDDTDCIQNKHLKKKIDGILNVLLETGRHASCSIAFSSHLACNGLETRRILNECHSVTVYPSSLGNKSLKYLLDNYFGLDKEQIRKIKRLNSRWVTIQKGFPMFVISEKECFILNQMDD